MSDAAARPDADAPPSQADADILRLVAGGDVAAAFALVMQRYQAKVYRLCVAYMRDATLAEDVAQDSLVRVWRALPRYDGRAALSTFIYAITRNRCLTALGNRNANAASTQPASQAEIDCRPSPAIQAERDVGHTIRQLVDELPDTTRRIVMLYYFEEASVAETSALTGLPEGTIKTHLFRARRQLRTRFTALGLDTLGAWHRR